MLKHERLHVAWIIILLGKNIKEIITLVLGSAVLIQWLSFEGAKFTVYIAIGVYMFFLLIHTFLSWFNFKYTVNEEGISAVEGGIKKTKKFISFSKIQGVHIHINAINRFFNLAAISIDSSSHNENSNLILPAISKKHAKELENYIHSKSEIENNNVNTYTNTHLEKKQKHNMSTKEILLISIFSIEFIMVIPFVFLIYNYGSKIPLVDKYIESLITIIPNSNLGFSITVAAVVLFSLIYGLITSILKYGNYETIFDKKSIYIKRGLWEKNEYGIDKKNISGLKFTSSIVTRFTKYGNLKVLCTEDKSSSDTDIKKVYTILPIISFNEVNLFTKLVNPKYLFLREKDRLPIQSLILKLLKATALFSILCWANSISYQIGFFKMLIVLLLMLSFQVLKFSATAYNIQNSFTQIHTGSLAKFIFIIEQTNIHGMFLSQNIIQKLFKVATVKISLQSRRDKKIALKDIKIQDAEKYYAWYKERLIK
ncbi:PH domain-containing protein [Marinococcus sp. PL1-022]|uniref:PH domain-containing protein n=1 Tax=Marinococcus sp. PL1-022 TaxID=3095363 RepID=UPI0029C44882|nr:PH domain-containing protein [Marinococcus sp. PL1-022]MDX6154477.1 PH domain-containing protein [Marinococcus sp. PL1-022]